MLPTKFESIGLSVQKKGNRCSRWPPSWISDWNNFSYFHIYMSYRCFLPIFKSTDPLVQENKRKKEFQAGRHGDHLGFPIQIIKAILDLQVTPMLPTKFRVKWSFSSEEEAKNRFSRWLSWQPSWISDRDDFSYFLSTGHPAASYLV